jgi:Ser/Thr protein kinase RdoA (MazF antagonist)
MSLSAPLALPVTHSLISARALQGQLLPLYFPAAATEVVCLAQGMHDTYLVRGPGAKYILRMYRAGWKTVGQVAAELEVLGLLKAQGLPVAYPVADGQGGLIQRIASPEGERYAVLFAYAEGEKVPVLTPADASRFGKYMASLHAITRGRQVGALLPNYSLDSILNETRQAMQIALPAHRDAHEKLDRIYALLRAQLTPAARQGLKTGICHGDPHHENLFIERATGKVTMFDFDFAGNGYLLYDLGSFCFYARGRKDNIAAFLAGYAQLMPLTPAELALVPCFTVLMRLFHLGARSRNADGLKNPLWFPDDIAAKIGDIESEAREHYV